MFLLDLQDKSMMHISPFVLNTKQSSLTGRFQIKKFHVNGSLKNSYACTKSLCIKYKEKFVSAYQVLNTDKGLTCKQISFSMIHLYENFNE